MLDSTQIVFRLLATAAVISIVTLAHRSVRPSLRKYPVKKVAWAVLAISAAFWMINVPYVRSYFDSSTKLAFPEEMSHETIEGKYIREHHHRIEALEFELKETKEELRELRYHYDTVIYIGWLAILFFTTNLIFSRNKEESAGRQIET